MFNLITCFTRLSAPEHYSYYRLLYTDVIYHVKFENNICYIKHNTDNEWISLSHPDSYSEIKKAHAELITNEIRELYNKLRLVDLLPDIVWYIVMNEIRNI